MSETIHLLAISIRPQLVYDDMKLSDSPVPYTGRASLQLALLNRAVYGSNLNNQLWLWLNLWCKLKHILDQIISIYLQFKMF